MKESDLRFPGIGIFLECAILNEEKERERETFQV
jgi:hypothetical protein